MTRQVPAKHMTGGEAAQHAAGDDHVSDNDDIEIFLFHTSTNCPFVLGMPPHPHHAASLVSSGL